MKIIWGLVYVIVFLSTAAVAEKVQQAPIGWHASGSTPEGYQMGIESAANAVKKSGYIKSKPEAHPEFGTWMQSFDAAPYLSKQVRFSAVVKTEDAEHAGLWMRIDGPKGLLGFDNMDDRA